MIVEIDTLEHPGVEVFARLTEAQLRNRLEPGKGIFIAESPKVINTAIGAGYEPLAFLCEQKHAAGDAREIIERFPGVSAYVGRRELLERLTGYVLTRGVLCAMRRPADVPLERVLAGARRVAVIDGVTDTTNIGAIFRSAAALGIDAVALTGTSCDPLNRRSIRVSMGSVFLVPWAWIPEGNNSLYLKKYGFKTVAMALRNDSVAIDSPLLAKEPRLAIVLGTEGDGLADGIMAGADYTVTIPMHHGVDSLNVAAASAVAFYQLCK